MKKTKKLLAVLLAMALALGLLPAAAMAACDPEVTITSITPPSSDVYQWQSGYSVGFGFEISCDTGTTLEAGQKVSVKTNIGELFSWEGSMSGLRVEQDGKLLCTVDITADTVTFNFAEGADEAMAIEGSLFTTALTAKDVGAEDGSDMRMMLQIGEKEAEIVFKFKSPDPPSSSSIGTVDVDTSWKNAWSCDNMAVSTLVKLGIITGRTESVFDPDAPITRAEAMTMINRVLERDPVNDADLLPGMRVWSDNPPAAWYYFAVQEATNSHEYTRPDAHEDWTKLTEDPDWTRYQ